MIRPEDLEFPPLDFGDGEELGGYYQDFSGALTLVEAGFHGPLGDDGIPRTAMPGQPPFPNPITVAQYAIANLGAERLERARALLDWLVAHQVLEDEPAGRWLILQDNAKYPWLRAPWTSALASGNALSALLRGHQQLGDGRYLDAARAAYAGLHSRGSAPRLADGRGGELWYEEYPAEPPLRVLNGHVYALLGVLDYARVTGDPEAHERWRRAAGTTLRHLAEFDLGYWSSYDLRWREPASRHYHRNIHIPLLRILGRLTGEAAFERTAERWTGQLNSPVSAVRRTVGARLHGIRYRRDQRGASGSTG